MRQIYGYRKFCNKIYQATKYVIGKINSSFEPQRYPMKSGHESLAELWILHKFNTAAAEINTALAAREFSQATRIAYEYWYDYLCDVYIENSKSIIQDGTLPEQESAKQTLYTALEGGLTMIHPFMPFLTEELWQRLPRRPYDMCPSIVLAEYPEYNAELDGSASEEAYELILAVSKAIRSLAAEYAIRESANVYIQLFTSQAHSTCETQLPSIKTLAGKPMLGSSASIGLLGADDAKPAGCIAQAVNAKAACYLLIKGHVDIDVEIQKAKTRLAKACEGVVRQRKIMEGLEKAGKMQGEIAETESRRLEDVRREIGVLEGSVSQFERLKLE